MKPLHQLHNTEKAALLFDLFPAEIPALLANIKNHCDYIIDQQEIYRKEWGQQFFSFDYWLKLAIDTKQIIDTNGEKLAKRKAWFTDQLFDMPVAVFVIDAAVKYRKHHKNNWKYAAMVELLFNP